MLRPVRNPGGACRGKARGVDCCLRTMAVAAQNRRIEEMTGRPGNPSRLARSRARLAVLAVLLAPPAAKPSPPEAPGVILTVAGPVAPATLGPTLTHEHVFVRAPEAPPPRRPAARELYLRPLALDILSDVEMGAPNRDNLLLDDEAVAARELADLRVRGGQTLVDLTLAGD